MIISGGVNIYPQEAENVLAGAPAVADVAVIGVPDAEMGEAVKAVVAAGRPVVGRARALEAELHAACRERLAAYKCPRSVDFVAELPRDPNGKLYKRLLSERYWEGHDTARRVSGVGWRRQPGDVSPAASAQRRGGGVRRGRGGRRGRRRLGRRGGGRRR